MKKTSLLTGIVLLILIVIFYNSFTNNSNNKNSSVKGHSTPEERLEGDRNNSYEVEPARLITRTVKNSKREQEYIKQRKRAMSESQTKWREVTQASEKDIRNATVSAEVNPGETLVTGGHKTRNGNYEFNFLTPISLDNTGRSKLDGSIFQLKSKIVSLRAEDIQDLGLERLISDNKNTSQHSEAWTQEILDQAFAKMADIEGVDFMNMPDVMVSSNEPFTASMGSPHDYILVEGSLDRNPNGGIKIQSIVERYEGSGD